MNWQEWLAAADFFKIAATITGVAIVVVVVTYLVLDAVYGSRR